MIGVFPKEFPTAALYLCTICHIPFILIASTTLMSITFGECYTVVTLRSQQTPITPTCIFRVDNFLKILAKFIDFFGADSDN
jgi:hypothetical protein